MSSERVSVVNVSNAKGRLVGRIHIEGGVTTIFWEDKSKAAMSFKGNASVIFGMLIINVIDGSILGPKCLLKRTTVELRRTVHSRKFWSIDLPCDPRRLTLGSAKLVNKHAEKHDRPLPYCLSADQVW